MNIVLCGFMGSGKTSVGKELAKITGKKFVDTDELIESEQGVSISEIFSSHGEDYFRDLEFEICKKISKMDNVIVSTGGGAMTYERNVKVIKENGVVIFLDASFDVICSRIGNGETRPLFKNRENAKKLYEERKSKYEKASDYTLSGDISAKETAFQIADLISKV